MKVEKSFFKRVIYFFKPFWRYFIITILILVVIQVFAAFSPYLFGKSVDAVIHHNFRLTFIFLGISFFLALIQSQVLWHIKEYVDIKYLDDNIDQALSSISLKKMFDFSIGQHTNEHSGVKQTIVNKGQNSLVNLFNDLFYNILQAVLQVLVTLIILACFDWKIAGVALSFVLLYVLVSVRRNKKIFPVVGEIRKKNQGQSKLQSELYRNATLVIAEGQEEKTFIDFDNAYTQVTNFTKKTWLDYLRIFYSHKYIIIIGQYATLSLGVYLILIGDHSTGMFVTFFSWTSSIFANLIMIMNYQRRMLFQIVEIKKYFDLLDITPDIDPNIGGAKIENFAGKIEFKNVNFAYPYRKSAKEEEQEIDVDKEEESTLENISFIIPAGAKIGFVGVSGSGKSTIVNLMRRYYEVTKGEILIDGVSIKELDLHWLRSQIGNVEQKIDLFDRSIRDNILFGLPMGVEIDEKRLAKAVSDASLDDFVAKLKDHGLDTMIGEGGIKVSGGERQRIGIARALIKEPKVLIFDEATSAPDSINEKLIHESINKSAKGRTTVIIAHRLSTVMDADIIFVVAKGEIVDSGTHTELEKRCKEYQKLIKNQILMQ